MLQFKKSVLILSSVFIVSLCAAQEKTGANVRKITVDDAVILAADNNINLKIQKINLDTLEKKDKYSWNSISPTISLGGGYSDSFVSGVWKDGNYTSVDTGAGNWTLSGSLNLRFTPAIFATMKTAKLNYEKGIVEYEEYIRSVERDVRKLFYSLIYSKENIVLQERNLETARVRYENNKDKYSRGQYSELDLLNSQYSYENLKPQLQMTVNNYENDLASFKQLLGIPQNEEIELTGSMNDVIPPKNIDLNVNVEDLPSIKKMEANIEALKIALSSAKFSAYGPNLSATYSYSLGGKLEKDSASSGRDSLSLNLSIPLDGYLPWSSGALSIDNQKSTIQAQILQLEESKTTAALTIENKIKSLNQQKAQVELYNQNVEIAQRTYDMTLKAYNVGAKDLLTLQSASDNLMSAELKRQQQLFSILSAVLDLENTLGIPFGTLGDKN